MRAVAPIRTAKVLNIFMSMCLLAFGIAVLAVPDMSERILAVTMGAALIGCGVFRLIGYFSRDLFRLAFQYDLQLGIALVFLGCVLVAKSGAALDLVCVGMGVALFTDGTFKCSVALQAHRFGIKPWIVMLAAACVLCGFGVALAFIPAACEHALKVVLGVALVVFAADNLIVMFTTVKIIKHQQSDNID